jgi:carbamoyltransferase
MIILWFNWLFSEKNAKEASVSLIVDWKVLWLYQEESFVWIKKAKGFLPKNALKQLLLDNNINISIIDIITIWWEIKNNDILSYEDMYSFRDFFKENLKWFKWKIEFIKHHISHASASYFLSWFSKAGVIVMDGWAESDYSWFVWIIDNWVIKILEYFYNSSSSVGQLYSKMTENLWFSKWSEWTVMALSSLWKNIINLWKTVDIWKKYFRILPSPRWNILRNYLKYKFPIDEFWYFNNKKKSIDLAYTLQQSVYNIYDIIYNKIPIEYRKNICLSWWCHLNILLNSYVLWKKETKDCYVDPFPSDIWVTLGSSFNYLWKKISLERYDLWPKFKWFNKNSKKYNFTKISYSSIAELLKNWKIIWIINWWREPWHRALWFRSILWDPSNINNKAKINKIKKREYFRPVALSIMDWFEKNTLIVLLKVHLWILIFHQIKVW